jgi:TonB family protein
MNKHLISKMFLVVSASLLWAACPSSRSTIDGKRGKPEIPFENKYFALLGEEYMPVETTPKPVSVHGQDGFTRRLYGAFSYPKIAMENGIEGIVLVEIQFDEKGEPKQTTIIKSLSKECDEAALKAMNHAVQDGFTPLLVDGKPVKFKIHMPVKFDLK